MRVFTGFRTVASSRGEMLATFIFAGLGALLMALLVGPLLALLLADPKEIVAAALRDQELLGAVFISFACAGVATTLSVVLGTPLAYLLARKKFRGKGVVRGLLSLPLVVPHPVVGIALLLLFARHRLLGAILEGRLGIEIVGAVPGIVLAMTFVAAPLVVRSVEEGVHGLDRRVELVAQGLGATPFQSFFLVTLPNIRPAVLSGMVAGLARGVSEFGSIAVIAYFPRTAPVLIWDRFTAFGLRGALPATGFLLIVSLVLFSLWGLLEKRRRVDD